MLTWATLTATIPMPLWMHVVMILVLYVLIDAFVYRWKAAGRLSIFPEYTGPTFNQLPAWHRFYCCVMWGFGSVMFVWAWFF